MPLTKRQIDMQKPRILVHFSCGAASAVAWKITKERYGDTHRVEAVYADMSKNEHPDNVRFLADCERWVGDKVTILSHPKYKDIDELFLDTGFIVNRYGATCTRTMKKEVRERYQHPDDIHVFGYTSDEINRVRRFELNNVHLRLLWSLVEANVSKTDCYNILSAASIELPVMYRLGYGHNNCIGCVKGGKGYWNKIRRDFPEVFAKRAEVQREIGCTFGGNNRFFLDELDPEAGRDDPPDDIECGPYCMKKFEDVKEVAGRLPLNLVTPPDHVEMTIPDDEPLIL